MIEAAGYKLLAFQRNIRWLVSTYIEFNSGRRLGARRQLKRSSSSRRQLEGVLIGSDENVRLGEAQQLRRSEVKLRLSIFALHAETAEDWSAADWEVRFSNSKQLPYFYNASTKQSIWDPPAGLSAEQIQSLPGAEKLAAGEPAAKPSQVRASHLLVKHEGSRRASSWKEANITRSKEEALDILSGHVKRLNETPAEKLQEEFAKLASSESDCSSAKKGGDLGFFGPGQMQAPFEHATFALQPGQMSGVVDTDSGVHVILRTA